MKTVFVAMPFEESSEWVYSEVLVELCRDRIELIRVDSSPNSRNIIQDIVEGICKCDLLFADLTGMNPNVLYELAIAHTLGKPTLMISDEVDALPFDFKTYRAIGYDHTVQGGLNLRRKLGSHLDSFLDGTSKYSNPVLDYKVEADEDKHLSEDSQEDEPGLLEDLAQMFAHFRTGTTISERYSQAMDALSETAGRSVTSMANAAPDDDIEVRLDVVANIARKLEACTTEAAALGEFQTQLLVCVKRIAKFYGNHASYISSAEENREAIEAFTQLVEVMEESTKAVDGLIVTIEGFQGLSTKLKRPTRQFRQTHDRNAASSALLVKEFRALRGYLS